MMAQDTSHGTDTETAHTEVAHVEDHGGGLPQMDTTTFASQLFWLAVLFGVLYVVLSRVALPKIGQVIEERRDRIADDLDKASQLKAETDKAIESYETALAEARARAHKMAQETRDAINEDVEQQKAALEEKLAGKLADAEQSIKATKETALANVREVAVDTAAAVVVQILGDEADQGAVDAAVGAALQNRNA